MFFNILGTVFLPTVEFASHTHHSFAILPLLLAAAPSIIQGINGIVQGNKADKIIKGNKRPVKGVNIAPELQNNVALAQYMASNNKLPGQDVAQNRLSSGVARGVGSLVDTQRDPASIAAGVAALDANYNKGVEDLTTQGAQLQQSNNKLLMQQRGILGAERTRQTESAWDWNEKQKYLSAMAAASALKDASARNKFSAVEGLSTLGVKAAMGGFGGGAGTAGAGGDGAGLGMRSVNPYDGSTLGGTTAQSLGGDLIQQNPLMQYRQQTGDYTTPDYELQSHMNAGRHLTGFNSGYGK